jgi:hypothetical protein
MRKIGVGYGPAGFRLLGTGRGGRQDRDDGNSQSEDDQEAFETM